MLTWHAGLAAPIAALLAGCAATPPLAGRPPVGVAAVTETVPVGTAASDAADDVAIWRDPVDPSRSLIVGTDKKAGLHVYGLDGSERSFAGGGLLNNVDLVEFEQSGIVVAASDRNDPTLAAIQFHRLDPRTGTLEALGKVSVGPGEAYGICLARAGHEIDAIVVLKAGLIKHLRVDVTAGMKTREMPDRRVSTQAEGCVVDERDGTLYVGEENVGIWRFAPGRATGDLVARVDNDWLVADVEGLALAAEGDSGGYLVASSQGDNAFAVFGLPGMAPLGRFRIVDGPVGAVEETDGIALDPRPFGAGFPGGLFIAQDGRNEQRAQNFKLVSWAAIRQALGL